MGIEKTFIIGMFLIILILGFVSFNSNIEIQSLEQEVSYLEKEIVKEPYDFTWNCKILTTCVDGRIFRSDVNSTWDKSTHSIFQTNLWDLPLDPLIFNGKTGMASVCSTEVHDCHITNVTRKDADAHEGVKDA